MPPRSPPSIFPPSSGPIFSADRRISFSCTTRPACGSPCKTTEGRRPSSADGWSSSLPKSRTGGSPPTTSRSGQPPTRSLSPTSCFPRRSSSDRKSPRRSLSSATSSMTTSLDNRIRRGSVSASRVTARQPMPVMPRGTGTIEKKLELRGDFCLGLRLAHGGVGSERLVDDGNDVLDAIDHEQVELKAGTDEEFGTHALEQDEERVPEALDIHEHDRLRVPAELRPRELLHEHL